MNTYPSKFSTEETFKNLYEETRFSEDFFSFFEVFK